MPVGMAADSRPQIHVTMRGPVFESSRHAIMAEMMHDAIGAIVDEGERIVVKGLDVAIYDHGGAHPNRYHPTGHARRMVAGDVTDSQHGVIHWNNLIYGPWLEGTSSRNDSTRFKGYAVFRQATDQLQSKALDIAREYAAKAVARLNG